MRKIRKVYFCGKTCLIMSIFAQAAPLPLV
jgi:hypothetical protein